MLFRSMSYGMQRYVLGERSSEGYTQANGVTFSIHPYKIEKTVTLTGVVEGKTPEGAVKEMKLMVPSYSTDMDLKLARVTVEGVEGNKFELVSTEELGNHMKDSSGWGDQHFCLNAQLGSGTAQDISVSYTHLDVYKRQVFLFMRTPLGIMIILIAGLLLLFLPERLGRLLKKGKRCIK